MVVIDYECYASECKAVTVWNYTDNQTIKGRITINTFDMSEAMSAFNELHPLETCRKLNVKITGDSIRPVIEE